MLVVLVFAAGHAHVERGRDFGVAFVIVGHDRFFVPENAQLPTIRSERLALVGPFRSRNPASFEDRLHCAEGQDPAPMIGHDHLFPGGDVTPLLVTARLANQIKLMLLQDSDDLIGG